METKDIIIASQKDCKKVEKMENYTRRQRKYIKAINEYIDTYFYAPTVREVAELMGVSSPATAHGMLKRLEAKGYDRKMIVKKFEKEWYS